MKRFMKFACGTIALSFALVVCCARPVLAEDAPPVPMATLTAKSLDAAAALAKEIGVDLPPFLTAAGIEEQFAFVGKGGMASDRPIGIIFFGAPGVQPQQLVTFVLPVKQGAATLDSLKGLGGQVMAGHPDTVVLNGQVGLRRTGDYLVFSPSAAAATVVDVDAFANAVKAPDALAKLAIDLKGVRHGMADLLKDFIDNIDKGAGNGDEAYKLGSGFVTGTVKNLTETLDRVELSLAGDNQAIRVSLTAAPAKPLTVAETNRPGMPAGVVARLDLGVPVGDAIPGMRDLVEKFTKLIDAEGKPKTEEEKKALRAVMTKAAALVLDPAATSVGFEVIGGEPVVFIAQHLSKQSDIPAEIREIVGAINTLQDKDKSEHLGLQTYEADGKQILRVTANEHGKPAGCLDIVQRGNDVLMVGSPSLEHHVQALLTAANGGAYKNALDGSVDLGKLVEAIATIPSSPLAGMPADKKKEIADLFQGRKISVTLSVHEGALNFELTTDRSLLQRIGDLVKR